MVFRVKVRGIYSTALAKILLEAGFKIVEASRPITLRLGVKPLNEPPDLVVTDSRNKWGIILTGKCEAFQKAVEALRGVDPIIIKARQRLHEVFVATPKIEGGRTLVEFEGDVLSVPERYVVYPARRLFTVVKPALRKGGGVAVPDIILDGNYVELSPSGRVSFSGHIEPQRRTYLAVLAERIRKKYGGIGLRFRSSAQYGSDHEIEREVEALFRRLVEISSASYREGERVHEGRCVGVALFDGESKRVLDSVRSTVAPTAKGHHMLKALGLGKCVDILDILDVDIYNKSLKFLKNNIEIIHIIPWGRMVKMSGELVGLADGYVIVKRGLKPDGTLEGIGKRIEEGDYALTCVAIGKSYVVHTYYTVDGKEKGTYININTIPEIGPKIVYIDLAIDKIIVDNREFILDEEEYMELAPSLPVRIREAVEAGISLRAKCTYAGLVTEGDSPIGLS